MIKPLFNIGDIVYLKTDTEQCARIVTAYLTRKGTITYCLALGINESWHYDIEISTEKDIVLKLNN